MDSQQSPEKVTRSDAEWREQLDPGAYAVLRGAATEPPFTGAYVDEKSDGVYRCRGCSGRALRLGHEVRLALRVAELHRSDDRRGGRAEDRQLARHDPHRGAVRPLRRPPGPRLRRRPRAERQAASASTPPRSTSSPRDTRLGTEALGPGQQRLGLRPGAEAAGRAGEGEDERRAGRSARRCRRRSSGRGRGTSRPARDRRPTPRRRRPRTGLSVRPRTIPFSSASACFFASAPSRSGSVRATTTASNGPSDAGARREERARLRAQQRAALRRAGRPSGGRTAPAGRAARRGCGSAWPRRRRRARSRSGGRRTASVPASWPPVPSSASRTSFVIASDGLPRNSRPIALPAEPPGRPAADRPRAE